MFNLLVGEALAARHAVVFDAELLMQVFADDCASSRSLNKQHFVEAARDWSPRPI
jgi:hypothetical protein